MWGVRKLIECIGGATHLPVIKELPPHVRDLELDPALLHLGQTWANEHLGNPAVNKRPTLPKED